MEIAADQVSFFKSVVNKGIARIDAHIPKDILALQEAAMKKKEAAAHPVENKPHRGRPSGHKEHKDRVKKK